MLRAKNGCLSLGTGKMDYIRFGSGPRSLVMLPGVGDGLKTVRGMALPFSLLYRAMARDFTVYVFSRRRQLSPHTTTREMAADVAAAMDALGLSEAAVLGVSQGGMIAQWLAIDHPEKLSRLVLAVTLSKPNTTVETVVSGWLEMAERGDYKGILLDTAERSYSPKRLRRARLSYGLLGNVGKPRSFERFRIQAESCVTHNAYAELPRIVCPTLVIGGTEDAIVTGQASREIASQIPGCELYLYAGLSHGLYEEAPDFLPRVMDFCR